LDHFAKKLLAAMISCKLVESAQMVKNTFWFSKALLGKICGDYEQATDAI
jgi:hypothetical protein